MSPSTETGLGVPLERPVARFRLRPKPGMALTEAPTESEILEALPGWKQIVEAYGTLEVRALFAPWSGLDELLERTLDEGYDRERQRERFRRYFGVPLPAGTDPGAARKRLLASLPEIEYLSIQSRVPPRPALQGKHYVRQKYLHSTVAHSVTTAAGVVNHASWEGIHLEAVRGKPGGRGEGQVFCDVEEGWHTNHKDLPAIAAPFHGQSKSSENHGLHVLSVIAAQGEGAATGPGEGCVGIAPDVKEIHLSSEWTAAGAHERLLAIQAAVEKLEPGSVLLLEMQVGADELSLSAPLMFVYPDTLLPCEALDEIADLIRLATALHIVVVEPAGNGNELVMVGGKSAPDENVDLDKIQVPAPTAANPAAVRAPFDPTPAGASDSGAILVGQAEWGSVGGVYGHRPLPKGCSGARIDAFAWGGNTEQVYVATWDGNTPHTSYTGFAGTSSASAIVAGVALVLQGLRHAAGLPYLTPLQMRALLRDPAHGTKSTPPTARIGLMPDLAQLGAAVGLVPDVYARDFVGDTGGTHNGPLAMSPDIVVKVGAAGPTPSNYAQGSGTEDRLDLSDPLIANQQAWVLVRARNRGSVDATGATAKAYFVPPSSLPWPSSWKPIGEANLPTLPANGALVVSDPISWANPPLGHHCLVAVVGCPDDPVLDPTSLSSLTLAEYAKLIRVENGLVWRNFTVNATPFEVTPAASSWALPFEARAFHEELELRVEAFLPGGSTLRLRIDEQVDFDSQPLSKKHDGKSTVLALPLGRTTLRKFRLPSDTRPVKSGKAIPMIVHVSAPHPFPRSSPRIAVVQTYGRQEVGRITWELCRPPDGDTPRPVA